MLEVTWCRASDELVVDLSHILAVAEDMEPTKRGVISLVSKIYDPLGLISPVVIRFKILFQELCSSKLAWDEPSSDALRERWRVLLDGLHSETLRIPRYDLNMDRGNLQLVGFVTHPKGLCSHGLLDG